MTPLTAGWIDVRAAAPLRGDPLAIVEDADGVADETLRRIAGEFNQAETTFALRGTLEV
jgi:predicted PhzF superfamily epimerase YddE/YHI9